MMTKLVIVAMIGIAIGFVLPGVGGLIAGPVALMIVEEF